MINKSSKNLNTNCNQKKVVKELLENSKKIKNYAFSPKINKAK